MNNSFVTVSIIIPCYNSAGTILETLSSVETQTNLPDEVIIVDDGSIDDTKKVLNDYLKSSVLNIQYYCQEHSGVSVARNLGIHRSQSDILIFLDADDCLCKFFVETCKNAFAEGYDCLFGLYTRKKTQLVNEKLSYSLVDGMWAMKTFMMKKDKFHTSAFAYSRRVVFDNDIEFTPSRKYGEDWEFTTKVMDCSFKYAFINSPVLFYRPSNNSAMTRIVYERIDAIYAGEDALLFLKKRNSPFAIIFGEYMIPKAGFSVLHSFAKYGAKDLYLRFNNEFDTKKMMKSVLHSKYQNFRTRIGASIFLLSKNLFYFLLNK